MIVDSHAHVDEVPALGWIDPPEALIAELDDAGIDRAVVMTYTDAVGRQNLGRAQAARS